MESQSLEKWRRRGKTFSYRGHEMFYRIQGKGAVLVLIHGFPTSSHDWSRLWPALAKDYRVVAPDLLGFGFSAKPPGYPYSCVDQASSIEALLEDLGAHQVHILCHDYGVSVTQELMARYKERRLEGRTGLCIRSVCFLNGGLFPETHRARPIQRLLLSPLGPLAAPFVGKVSFGKAMTKIFSPDYVLSSEEIDDFWETVLHNRGKRVIHRLLQYIPERRSNRSRWVGAMVQTTIPVRFVNGALDPVSGSHVVRRYQELIPNADIVSLDRVGHYPQWEAPETLLRAYRDFTRSFTRN